MKAKWWREGGGKVVGEEDKGRRKETGDKRMGRTGNGQRKSDAD